MASGTLGKVNLLANTNAILYSTEIGKLITATLSFCNRSNTQALLKVAISSSATPAPEDYIEFNTVIPPYGVLERTGVVVSSPNKIIVTSSIDNVSAVAYGFEDML